MMAGERSPDLAEAHEVQVGAGAQLRLEEVGAREAALQAPHKSVEHLTRFSIRAKADEQSARREKGTTGVGVT